MPAPKEGTTAPARFDPKNFDHLATRFLEQCYVSREPQLFTVYWWKENFWTWDGTRYICFSEKKLLARVLAWLPGVVNRPTTKVGLEMIAFIKAKVTLDLDRQPAWLTATGPEPRPNLIAMANGILDLSKLTGVPCDGASESDKLPTDILIPHTPAWFSPNCLEYAWNPDAECPRWLAFLAECLEDDPDRIALVQEWFGYCLTPDTTMQKAMFFEGDGANGKSVAIRVLEALVGLSNCSHVSLENFGREFDLHSTVGKLLNSCSDIPEISKVAEGIFKKFVAGDRLNVRDLYRSATAMLPTARLMVAMNTRPRFLDRSEGVWRRILIVPWNLNVEPTRQDPMLANSTHPDWPFRPELPGIFNWALEGRYRLQTNRRFTFSQVAQNTLADFRLESNPAAAFLAERCVADPGAVMYSADLYSAYVGWCKENGHDRPLSKQKFSKEVKRAIRGSEGPMALRIGNRVGKGYRGLRLQPSIQFVTDDAVTVTGMPLHLNSGSNSDLREVVTV